MPTPIQLYLREIDRAYAAGNATEHTYRPAFKALVESFGKNVRATNEPKRVACGAPDFIVAQPEVPIGSIECKDVGTSLDETEKTDQLKRYFGALENLILTDYLEFRYYVRGEQKMHVNLARIDAKGKIKVMEGADKQLATLFDSFLAAQAATINTPKELAARMANVAKIIREAIEKAFTLEGEAGTLHGEYESFRATILGDITPVQFADMYAQTVCYGMFSARVNVPDQNAAAFTREHAAYDLPKTNPFPREVFEYIAGTKLDPSIVWAVDLLALLLRHCDMGEILKNFGKATRQEDPVVHFYETFLAAYDATLREARGVYYTPEPVVSFIVRSIDAILKRDFDCPAGLADSGKVVAEFSDSTKKGGKVKREVHRVQILDPATGTGTFLFETIRHIRESMSPNSGMWAGERGYVAQHLLPRLYGFELMMAPYAVAHMKLGWLLKETGYDFAANERLRVYLTNTLEESEIVAGPLLALASQIAQEANAAGKVKTECPIMVVMGNPPYSKKTYNKNPWIDGLMEGISAKLGFQFCPDGQGDLKKTFGPEDVFRYAYAVFHSPTYRCRYAEFLKIDFPRLPQTSDKAVFARLVGLGRELAGLHLLEKVPAPQATYPQAGDNLVSRTGNNAYKPPTSQVPGRVYINDAQYFENVAPEVWAFHVGGYQVCEKWLKDRKGRTLSYDDIEHYRKMTEAVRQTLRLMEEIDKAIPSWPLT